MPQAVEKYGGVCFPAHIDRQSNGLLAVLGFFPEKPYFPFAEVHGGEKAAEYAEKYGKKIITSSDAHYLWDINERGAYIELDCGRENAAPGAYKLFAGCGMKEISLNILDIAENSVKARATLTEITVNETDDTLTLKISDNGCGMTAGNAESRNRPVLHHAHHAQGGNGAAAFKNGSGADGRHFRYLIKSRKRIPRRPWNRSHGGFQ